MGDIGAPELLIVLAVIVLMVGGAKLPDLARGAGQALRIFKSETATPDDHEQPRARLDEDA